MLGISFRNTIVSIQWRIKNANEYPIVGVSTTQWIKSTKSVKCVYSIYNAYRIQTNLTRAFCYSVWEVNLYIVRQQYATHTIYTHTYNTNSHFLNIILKHKFVHTYCDATKIRFHKNTTNVLTHLCLIEFSLRLQFIYFSIDLFLDVIYCTSD